MVDPVNLPKNIRAFVAIFPDVAVAKKLALLQTDLKKEIPGQNIRWTPPEQIHLTLQFLGNIPGARISEFQIALSNVAQHSLPFETRAETVGCFSNVARPKILWVGLAGDGSVLLDLQNRLAGALEILGIRREDTPFHPHLTLGRFGPMNFRERQCVSKAVGIRAGLSLGQWTVPKIDLMRSELSPGGARYQLLDSFALGADR